MKQGMEYRKAVEAAARMGGRFGVFTAWSEPTAPEVFAKRKQDAAAREAVHRAIGRVKVSELVEHANGKVSVLFSVGGAINRDIHPEGVYLNKKGVPCVDVVISAPVEYGITTFCKYAGVEGSACERRAPYHAHRTINLSRLVSWLDAGEELNR